MKQLASSAFVEPGSIAVAFRHVSNLTDVSERRCSVLHT
jgi:hypothetical protein